MTFTMNNLTIFLDIEKVKILRKIKGYTQSEIAYILNIEQSTYSKLEKGITRIDVERLFKLSQILEVNPTDLLQNTSTNTFNINTENNLVTGRIEHFYNDNKALHRKVMELEKSVKELLTMLSPKDKQYK